MSNEDGRGGVTVRSAETSWRVAGLCAGLALAEALFFTFLGHFRHPRPLWDYGMPWVLAPAVPVPGALLGLLTGLRRPAGGRVLATVYGAFLAGVVLAAACGGVMLLDLMMSD
ncbi:hypothetical protein [Kutzneria kofuensis]|uniref:Uncharacterized protein n=1 Tax=Kutzneria kofuensis TaxID=103725 RepID=A0A7W9KPD0_9PSEU|nr:hypothetical protein [Kutzneria kofuensis]MBB5896170.1 hypothetical protein [Kutzneria kofuensis]